MKSPNIDLRTKRIKLEEESEAGLRTIDLEIPEQYDKIVGVAVFMHNKPSTLTDVKINIASSTQDYFNLTTTKVFESGNGVAPDNKFMSIEIPCTRDLTTQLKLRTEQEIPTGETLEFDIVLKVIDKSKYNNQGLDF